MAEESQSFVIPAGNTRTLAFTIKNTTGAPIDVGAATCEWWVSDVDDADTVHFKKKTTDVGNVIRLVYVGETLMLYVDLFEEDTIDLEPGVYYHEAQIIIPDELRDTIAIGRMKVTPTIIR
jgi:hypothetical protein